MGQAGRDMRDVLAKTQTFGDAIERSEPVALLQRVFDEQFETTQEESPSQRRATPAGAVHNPHDPSAEWSTKGTLGKGRLRHLSSERPVSLQEE
jgi:hypothetical protein